MLAVGCDQRRGVERLVVRLDALLRAERDDVGMPEERSFDKLVALRDETLQVLIEGLWSMMAVAERERERERERREASETGCFKGEKLRVGHGRESIPSVAVAS